MKRLLMVTLFLVVASVPAYANQIDCYSYYDNEPSWDYVYSYCSYSQGSMCFACVDVQAGSGCADGTFCDPNSRVIHKPRTQLAHLSPAQGTGRVQVAAARRGHPSRTGHSDSIRPVSMRVARLNAGNLL